MAVVAAGCSSAGSGAANSPAQPGTTTPSSTSPPRTWSVVALGDSVPYGSNCGCTPYPELTGEDLAAPPERTVTVTNNAVGGFTTDDVLHQLTSDPAVIDQVRRSDVVEIEVGANDVGHSGTCGSSVACYQPAIPTVEKNLAVIVARTHELTAGRRMLVVLLDYWSVWLGGQYAAAQGDAYVAAAAEVTDQVNTVINDTAATTHSGYVDLRAAFKGPDYAYDESHYLSSDGDHPNAAGHQQIAAATVAVIRSALGI